MTLRMGLFIGGGCSLGVHSFSVVAVANFRVGASPFSERCWERDVKNTINFNTAMNAPRGLAFCLF